MRDTPNEDKNLTENNSNVLNLSALSTTIQQVHLTLQASAANAVNKTLTIRNWLIGYYIVEYEQKGQDRAEYGTNLLSNLAKRLNSIKGLDERSLRNIRQFYSVYSFLSESIRGSLTSELRIHEIWGSLTPELKNTNKQANHSILTPPEVLISKLSYTHFELLIKVSDQLKRTFYELECIKGTWSVRELKRQISSLYFERSGLSQNPEKLSEMILQKSQPQSPKDIIKNIYSFEFLDLGIQSIVEESDLETALLNHLQQFIIEMGNGFCFEARQKRLLIGDSYYFIDLVFYHRVLKCHVLIELKIGAFEHGDIGQLNTYLNFFKEELMESNDNPPVGILLVAEKDQALVKYATAGLDDNLFVQQYLLQLPNLEQLKAKLENELKNLRP